MSNVVYSNNKLYHYGVKGMRWGVRKDNKHSQLKVRTGRLNKFGKNGHNILYVTGISGSGKSTLALNLAKTLDAEPIHLDWYYDGRAKHKTHFSNFLKDNGVNLKNVYKNNKLNYDESDKIFPLLQKYSENRKLVVEGVQLLDDTMAVDLKKILANEPVISVQTNAKIAFNRATERDQSVMDYSNFIKAKQKQEIYDNKILLNIGEAYVDSLIDLDKGGNQHG